MISKYFKLQYIEKPICKSDLAESNVCTNLVHNHPQLEIFIECQRQQHDCSRESLACHHNSMYIVSNVLKNIDRINEK